MFANFIIPTFVSPSVDEELVPALAKLIERNIALYYKDVLHSVIRDEFVRRQQLTKKESAEDYLLKLIDGAKSLEEYCKEFEYTEEGLFKTVTGVGKTEAQKIKEKIDKNRDKVEEWNGFISKYKGSNDPIAIAKVKEARDEVTKLDNEFKMLTKLYDIEKESKEDEKEEYSRKQKKAELMLKKRKLDSDIERNNKEEKDSVSTQTATDRTQRADITQAEVPREISMFSTISLEPTFLEFQEKDGENISTATVTFKCVPYTIEDTENFISLLQSKRSLKGIRGLIEKSLGRTWRKLWRNIWLTAARYINRNRNEDVSVMYPTDPGDKVWLDIKYAPDHDDLLDKKVMAKRMREYGPVQGWASLVIISTDDFPEGFDMIKFFKDYRRLAYTSGFGDIVIIDPDKEAVNFCSLALLSCQRLSFSYLSKVINLPNVIDFNNAKKYERPFNVSPKRI